MADADHCKGGQRPLFRVSWTRMEGIDAVEQIHT